MTILVFVLTMAACGDQSNPGSPPQAVLKIPTQINVGDSILLDGRASTDPDGDIAAYRFVVADGSGEVVTADPIITHTFMIKGWIEVRLIVRDTQGNRGEASARISVREP
ncbi:MAG: PKD domain-containing protein [Deltaproteobacteria bacterium]|nr:PKD domain-containing protein [Deltaproteobacteria bacterium]